MDPTTVASACSAVALLYIRTSTTVYGWISQTKAVDKEAQAFVNEIRAYARVLSTIDQNLRRAAIASAVRQNSLESELWYNVTASLDDCTETLSMLDRVLDKIRRGTEGLFRKTVKNVWLNMATDQITRD
jgi:hypothetical protein